jgi:hypothetical protein
MRIFFNDIDGILRGCFYRGISKGGVGKASYLQDPGESSLELSELSRKNTIFVFCA